MRIILRAEAKAAGLKRYFTGKPCVALGHIGERRTSTAQCVECVRISVLKWQRQNRVACKEATENWRKRNLPHLALYKRERYGKLSVERKLKHNAATRAYYHKNRIRMLTLNKQYAAEHPEQKRAIRRRWKDRNPGKVNAIRRRRQIAEFNQVPPWSDSKQIDVFYKVAAALSRRDGIEYHVDHMIPIQGKTVSGLHVHYNLAVIPAIENIKKGNRLTVAL